MGEVGCTPLAEGDNVCHVLVHMVLLATASALLRLSSGRACSQPSISISISPQPSLHCSSTWAAANWAQHVWPYACVCLCAVLCCARAPCCRAILAQINATSTGHRETGVHQDVQVRSTEHCAQEVHGWKLVTGTTAQDSWPLRVAQEAVTLLLACKPNGARRQHSSSLHSAREAHVVRHMLLAVLQASVTTTGGSATVAALLGLGRLPAGHCQSTASHRP